MGKIPPALHSSPGFFTFLPDHTNPARKHQDHHKTHEKDFGHHGHGHAHHPFVFSTSTATKQDNKHWIQNKCSDNKLRLAQIYLAEEETGNKCILWLSLISKPLEN